MTDDALIRAIAEDRGWRRGHSKGHGEHYVAPDLKPAQIPQWLTDANAAHELIEVLRGEGWQWQSNDYTNKHIFVAFFKGSNYAFAVASTFCRAVAECYAKVKGIWKE